ncbi:MGDG synthase family glycosyltransferase [Seinonella peptonophila]|nr:glycosyltransferase [Seinonella peptonophila]
MERILLLSMGFGTGHNAVAKVLQAEFQQQPGVQVEMIDLLDLIPKTFHPLLQNSYLGMLNRFPRFYHYLYDWTHQSKWIRSMSTGFIAKMGWTIRKKMNQLLDDLQPTKIVTTHPFALLVVPTRWLDIPSVGVITDYELHPVWFARVPDLLCIPRHLLSRTQIERIEWTLGTEILETGIPIDRSFYQEIPAEIAKENLGLPFKQPIVLMMGGGAGLGPFEELVKKARQLKEVHFVVMTGNNEQLFQMLSESFLEHHVQIESYRQDIPLWMSAADLLITKPGGVTITEAVAKQLPMYLFESFPGQEEANQQHLLTKKVAWATQPEIIHHQIEDFFSTDVKLKTCQRKCLELATPEAIDQIVSETLELDIANAKVFYL